MARFSELNLHISAVCGNWSSSLAWPGAGQRNCFGGNRNAESPYVVRNSRRLKRISQQQQQAGVFGLSLSFWQLEMRQQFYNNVRNEKKTALRNGTKQPPSLDAQASVQGHGCCPPQVCLCRGHTHRHRANRQLWPKYSPSCGCTLNTGSLHPVAAAGPARIRPCGATSYGFQTVVQGFSFSNDNMTRNQFSIRFGRGDCWSFSTTFISIMN